MRHVVTTGDPNFMIDRMIEFLGIGHFDVRENSSALILAVTPARQPADRAGDARHDDRAAGAPAHRRRVVEIDPREGGRKAVRIALAADLAIGDDVDPGPVMVGLDRDVVKGRGSD